MIFFLQRGKGGNDRGIWNWFLQAYSILLGVQKDVHLIHPLCFFTLFQHPYAIAIKLRCNIVLSIVFQHLLFVDVFISKLIYFSDISEILMSTWKSGMKYLLESQ